MLYGPYIIIQHIRQVTYKLPLPNQSKIHLEFYVSCLNKVVSSNCKVQIKLLELDEEGSIWLQLKATMDIMEHQLHRHIVKEVLIQWNYMQP